MTMRRLPTATDKGADDGRSRVSRRDFSLLLFSWMGLIAAFAAAAAGGMRSLLPNLLFEPSRRFRAGAPDAFPDGGVTLLDEIKVFILRKGNSYRALSAVCTHLGCTVNQDPRAPGRYRCPCHGSSFDEEGQVTAGPAPRPLTWYAVIQSRDGRLVVDRDSEVPPSQYLVLASEADADRTEQA